MAVTSSLNEILRVLPSRRPAFDADFRTLLNLACRGGERALHRAVVRERGY